MTGVRITGVTLSQRTADCWQQECDVIVAQVILETNAVGLRQSHGDVTRFWRHEWESKSSEQRELGTWLDESRKRGDIERGETSNVDEESITTNAARDLIAHLTKQKMHNNLLTVQMKYHEDLKYIWSFYPLMLISSCSQIMTSSSASGICSSIERKARRARERVPKPAIGSGSETGSRKRLSKLTTVVLERSTTSELKVMAVPQYGRLTRAVSSAATSNPAARTQQLYN